MADDGTREISRRRSGNFFSGGATWRRVQDSLGRIRSLVLLWASAGLSIRGDGAWRRIAARRLERIGAGGPSSGGGATRVDDGGGDVTSR
jgi:hypothetical protein